MIHLVTFAKCYLTIRIDVRFLDFYGLTPVATSVISTSSRPMKAITFQGIQSLAYEDIPDPGLLDSTDAIIRVTAAGICGSDLHPYFGREQGLDVGTVMGHELLGEVVVVGSDVRNFSIGDIGVAPFTTNCGSCFFCRSGLTARC